LIKFTKLTLGDFFHSTSVAGHDEGAQNWARLASLIGTCKLNGVEPFAYMKATLEALATGHRNADIDMLLPWNFSALRTAAAA
jgi:transposase